MKKTKNISIWLFTCAASVLLMAMIGAITRITESGLSIVEWKPLTGALPPIGDTAWQATFDLYKESPQYKQVNTGMSLSEFKNIYFWEWFHRLWGRMIGIIYFIPFVYFWIKKQIPASAKKPLIGILILGASQGLMGWVMVMSGLVDEPAVSHYRLAAHLFLAVIIFMALFYAGLSFKSKAHPPTRPFFPYVPLIRSLVKMTIFMACLTIIWGAFVAGLRAGWIYNTFPFMGDNLWPSELLDLSPYWRNIFENHAGVQFTHRVLAIITFVLTILTAGQALLTPCSQKLRKFFIALGAMGVIQLGLGIATLLTGVNIILATLHQGGAFVLLSILLTLLYHLPASYKKGSAHA